MRISVSDLDAFRYYRESELTLEEFISRLKRETPPTPAMLAGTALHKILENGDGLECVTASRDGFHFNFDCDAELSLPTLRELKGEVLLDTQCGPVTLVGVVDGMDAGTIYDYKLTGRWDAEKYADSYQWRCYLSMFNASKFVYRVFVGSEVSSGAGFDGEGFSEWTIREYHELPLYRYPGMVQDVTREVEGLVNFLRAYAPEAKAA